MISKETAQKIWTAYREIETAEKLLSDLKDVQEKAEKDDTHAKSLRDVFGRDRGLELGVPSGRDCHRLLHVRPNLAEPVIKAHIGNMRAELTAANEIAKLEFENEVIKINIDKD